MKTFRSLVLGLLLSGAFSGAAVAQATNTNNITGQWDFNSSTDILRATTGEPLVLLGQTGVSWEQREIDGGTAGVMRFPAFQPSEGLVVEHGAETNGGGLKVNDYTIIMDVMWPSGSDGMWRAIFNTDTNFTEDAVLFVNPDNAVGISNNYALRLDPETWYRLTLVYNLTNGTMTRYLNGTNDFSVHNLGGNAADSRLALGPTFHLFTDNDGETAVGYINSLQIRSVALTPEEVEALGGPSVAGIPGLPIVEDVVIESITRDGNEVVITTSGGGTQQLERTVTLTEPNWQNAGVASASGTFRVPIQEATGFFRVRRI